MESVLKIEHIEKYYGNRGSLTKAVDDISFDVEKQEFVAIMGASGSGKTTLLNCISTIDRVTSGHIYMNGKEITKLKGNALNRFRREELGFIFQDFNLLDTLTAYENIALALTIQGKKAKDIEKQVKEIAKKLNITDVLKKPVLTEKSLLLQQNENKYTFDVDLTANKTEVKVAVEKMFDVKVESVNIMNVKPKTKRMGRYVGKTKRRRKAIVKLKEGYSINLFGEE